MGTAGGDYSQSEFSSLNANIFIEETGELIAQPFTILEKSGVKIGVIGVMGIDAFITLWHHFTVQAQH